MSKLIVFCFDGTGDDETRSETDAVTNVVKVAELLVSDDTTQQVFYAKGIATGESDIKNRVQYITGGGLGDIRDHAVEKLEGVYQPGDEVAVFGFSRGAATARGFVNVLGDAKKTDPVVPVRFLGVWDSVKFSVSISLEQSIPHNIAYTCHLVAVDEQREPFTPTLIDSGGDALEVWFPGDHSDVGGGHLDSALSDIALKFMIKRAIEHGVAFRPGWDGDLPADDAYSGVVHKTDKALMTGPREIRAQRGASVPKLHASVIAKMEHEASYRPSNVVALASSYEIVGTG